MLGGQAATAARNPGSAGRTPPAPRNGSANTAAMS